ncbi:hypothetical protein [Legionella spiritensis]|uniref:hypothetical protein n=1 Tax=Legionella spiritensis TaxID=452 RepID=UPI000F700CDF|nr:hypothetical protein [Legionella spiritensis]VEG90375.1 Uncharacterised protein [Legionella spiritensis]
MPFRYKFHPAINREKAFETDFCKDISLTDYMIPDDFLEQLATLCGERRNYFDKKAGKHSSYTLKKQLRAELKLIYLRLNGDLNEKLHTMSPDEKKALITKLKEGSTKCTPGFHNRVRSITQSFYQPQNFSQLLTRVRQNLVTKTASSLSGEVHANNRVTVIAAADGLGVEVNFAGDIYEGRLSEGQIRVALNKTFRKSYTPASLPLHLSDELRGILMNVGYIGHHEQGYGTGTMSQIAQIIHAMLGEYLNEIISIPFEGEHHLTDWSYLEQLFLKEDYYDEDGDWDCCRLVDINWPLIQYCFWVTLVEEGVIDFCGPRLLDVSEALDYALYAKEDAFLFLMDCLANHPAKSLKSVFLDKKKGVMLLHFLNRHLEELDRKKVKDIFAVFNSQEGLVNPGAVSAFLDCLESHKDFIGRDTIKEMLMGRGSFLLANIALITLGQGMEALPGLISFLEANKEYLNPDVLEEILRRALVEIAVPGICKPFLNSLKRCPHDFLPWMAFVSNNSESRYGARLLTKFLGLEKSLLLVTMKDRPDVACDLLPLYSRQKDSIGAFYLGEIFSCRTWDGGNVLSLAVCHSVEAGRKVLDFFNDNKEAFEVRTLKEILSAINMYGEDIFWLIVSKQSDLLPAFIDFIWENKELFERGSVKKTLLMIKKQGITKFIPESSQFSVALLMLEYGLMSKEVISIIKAAPPSDEWLHISTRTFSHPEKINGARKIARVLFSMISDVRSGEDERRQVLNNNHLLLINSLADKNISIAGEQGSWIVKQLIARHISFLRIKVAKGEHSHHRYRFMTGYSASRQQRALEALQQALDEGEPIAGLLKQHPALKHGTPGQLFKAGQAILSHRACRVDPKGDHVSGLV